MASVSIKHSVSGDPLALLVEVAEAQSLSWAEHAWSKYLTTRSREVESLVLRRDLSGRIRRLLETLAGNRVFRGTAAAGLMAEVHDYLLRLDPDHDDAAQDEPDEPDGQDIDPAADDAS